MVGSTYYGAIQRLVKYAGNNEKGERIYVPRSENEKSIFAAIFLTSTDAKDYYNFSYKEMDETVGPCYYDCPKGILDLLTPTNNEWANNWRTKCREQLEKKKNPNSLNKLPEGTVIQVTMPFDTRRYREGDVVKLTKAKWGKRCKWFASSCYFTQGLMKSLEGHYEIIKRRE